MSVLSGYGKYKRYVLTDTGYKLCSQWTSSNTVHFDDGKTAQTKLGAISGITDSLTATSSNVALSAKAGKSLQDQVTELNTGLNYRKIGNITFASGWVGTVSCGYITPHVGMIWGRVQKTSTGAPVWGEKILSISDFPAQSYYHALNVFLSSGTVINSLALTPQGTINCYPPDYDKIEPDKFYHLWGLFYIN